MLAEILNRFVILTLNEFFSFLFFFTRKWVTVIRKILQMIDLHLSFKFHEKMLLELDKNK